MHSSKKKPSQLLRELHELVGNAVLEDLLKTLWTQRLSLHTKAILSANDGSLSVLATMADKIQEVTTSTFHLVPKKKGDWRPCGDYGRLNNSTISDKYTVPHIQGFTQSLAEAKVFF